jgi:hypothetical protein
MAKIHTTPPQRRGCVSLATRREGGGTVAGSDLSLDPKPGTWLTRSCATGTGTKWRGRGLMRIRSHCGSGCHWSRSWRTGPVPNTERPNTWSNGGVPAFRFTLVAGWPLGRRLWGHFFWPSCLTHLPVENWPLKSFHLLFPCPLIFLLHTQPLTRSPFRKPTPTLFFFPKRRKRTVWIG